MPLCCQMLLLLLLLWLLWLLLLLLWLLWLLLLLLGRRMRLHAADAGLPPLGADLLREEQRLAVVGILVAAGGLAGCGARCPCRSCRRRRLALALAAATLLPLLVRCSQLPLLPPVGRLQAVVLKHDLLRTLLLLLATLQQRGTGWEALATPPQ